MKFKHLSYWYSFQSKKPAKNKNILIKYNGRIFTGRYEGLNGNNEHRFAIFTTLDKSHKEYIFVKRSIMWAKI